MVQTTKYSEKKIFLRKSITFTRLLSLQYNWCCTENIDSSIGSLFHGDWCSELCLKKVRWQNWMSANFNVRKMCSTVERMDGCENSAEIIIVPLKERIAGINFFLEINILLLKELLKQWMIVSSPVKVNTALFIKWITAILFMIKTDKGWMAATWVEK